MLTIFEQAKVAFVKKDYNTARILYGECANGTTKEISSEIRDAAIYMVTLLYLQKLDFQQALIYSKLLEERSIHHELLPKGVHAYQFSELIKQILPKMMNEFESEEINFSGYPIKGKLLEEIIEILKKKPSIKNIVFSYNPMDEKDVNTLLDFLLTRKNLSEIDLRGLPLNLDAIEKIITILSKIEPSKDINFPAEDWFRIRVTKLPPSYDLTIINRALRKVKSNAIAFHYGEGESEIIWYSQTIEDFLQQQQTASLISQMTPIRDNSTKMISHFISKGTVKLIDKTKRSITLKNHMPTKGNSQVINETHEIFYDLEGKICAHLYNKESIAFLHVFTNKEFILDTINIQNSYNILFVSGIDAKIIVKDKFEVEGKLTILANSFVLSPNALLKSQNMTVVTEHRLSLSGHIQYQSAQFESDFVYINKNFHLSPIEKKFATICIKARDIDLVGGKFQADNLQINYKRHLVLPFGSEFDCKIIKLSGDENVCIRSRVTSDEIYINSNKEAQLCKSSEIRVKKCMLNATSILLRGRLSYCELLDLHADGDIYLDSISNVYTKHIRFNGKSVDCLGKLNFSAFSSVSDRLKLAGFISTFTESKFKRIYPKEPMPHISIQTNALEIDGKLKTDLRLSIIANKIFFTSRGSICSITEDKDLFLREQQTLFSRIQCKEKLYLTEGAQLERNHNLVIETHDLSVFGLIKSSLNIQLEIAGSGEIHDSGKIHAAKIISLEGSRCWNSGDIHADEFLNLGFDRFFINGICDFNPIDKLKEGKLLGKLSSKNICINTAFFFGLLSNIQAENSLQINAFLDLYIGLLSGKIINRSNIVGINLGINITAIETIKSIVKFMRDVVTATVSQDQKIKTVIKEYYDTTDGQTIAVSGVTYALQIAGIAAKLLTIFAPQIGIPANIILGAINLLLQLALNGVTIKREITKLIERYESGKPIHARHVYPLILGIKNIAMTGANAVSMGMGIGNTFTKLPEQVANSHESLLSTLPSVVGLLGGSITDQSVIQIDAFDATITGMSNSISAVHFSAYSQNLAGVNFENSFISESDFSNVVNAMRSVTTNQFKESQGHQINETETIIAKKVELGGNTLSHHLTAVADHFTQESSLHATTAIINANDGMLKGDFKIDSGSVQINHLKTTENSHVDLNNVYLSVKEGEFSGLTDLHKVTGKIDNLNLDQGGSIHLSETSIKAIDTHLNGQAELQDSYLETSSLTQTSGHVQAEKSYLAANGVVQGESGSIILSESTMKVATTQIDGKLELKESYLETSSGLKFDGQILLDKSCLSAGDINQGQNGFIDLSNSDMKVSTTHMDGQVKLQDSVLESSSAVKFLGNIQSDNSYIKAAAEVEFVDGGHSQLKDTTVESFSIHQNTKAHLDANGTLFKGNTIQMEGTTKVDNVFALEAENLIIIDESSSIKKGKDSEVQLHANKIDRKGEIDVDKIAFQASFSSDEVNQLGTDKKLHAIELKVISDQDLIIDRKLTVAQDITIVGKSVKDNAAQNLHTFALGSTKGNIEINKPINTTGKTTIYSEGKTTINDSMKGSEVDVYGKQGIGRQNLPTQKEKPKSSKQTYYGNFAEYYSNRVQQYRPKSTSPKVTLPQKKISLEAGKILLQSGEDINLTGIHVNTEDLQMKAKGKVIFDINNQKNHYTPENFFGRTPSSIASPMDYSTSIYGKKTVIEAHDLINNGQLLYGDNVDIYLEGNLYNMNKGKIAANEFLFIDAKNVYNKCNVRKVRGEYGTHEEYDASYLIGGEGKEHKGVGMYIHTSEKVVNDASSIRSKGSNLIEADGGFETIARSNTYTTYKNDESHFLGLSKKHEEIRETLTGRSELASINGQNIIESKQGGLYALATDFSAKDGTYIHTKGNAEFYDLIGSTEVIKSSRTLGLFYDHERKYDEYSEVSRIADLKGITIVTDGRVKMRSTEVLTPGHFYVQAKGFDFDVSKLEHTYTQSSFGMSATLFDQEFFKMHNPCDFTKPIFNGDPTACQFNQLLNSKGAAEILLNGWSTGINLANTANAMTNGFRTGTLLAEGLKRELPSIYAPQLGINFTKTQTSSTSETLGAGGIYVGSAEFKVQDKVKLSGGPVDVLGDFTVDCKDFEVNGKQVHNKVDQKTENLNLTISAKGDPYEVGVSTSHCSTESMQQINNQVRVGGTLNVHANTMTIDGAVIDTNKMAGSVGTLNIITRADESHNKSENYGVSTGGDFCIAQQKTDSKLVQQAAELHVHDSINARPGEFTVGKTNLEGGKIISDGVNNFKTGSISSHDVEEYNTSSGFCINGNLKDFKQDTQVNHLLPSDKQSAQITTTNFGFNKSEYKAENHGVIYGAAGTNVQSGSTSGTILNNTSEGKEVSKDSSHHYNVVIPHMTPETQAQFELNRDFISGHSNNHRQDPLKQQNNDQLQPQIPNASTLGDDLYTSRNSGAENELNFGSGQNASAVKHSEGTSNLSQDLDRWQQNSVNNFNNGLNFGDRGATDSYDGWQREAVDYYANSAAVSKRLDTAGSVSNDSVVTTTYLSYFYEPAKSFEEQGRLYFQEEMYGVNDYEHDTRSENNKLDLTFTDVEIPKPKSRLDKYQNSLSKPKDWESSLPKWERETYEDFVSERNEQNTPHMNSRYQSVNERLEADAPIPIYQLPKFKREHITPYEMIASKNQDPIRIRPEVVDFAKAVGKKIIDDQVQPFKDIWNHPKAILEDYLERTKGLGLGMNPMEAVCDNLCEAAINQGLEWVDGDAVAKTALGIEIGASLLFTSQALSRMKFFRGKNLTEEPLPRSLSNLETRDWYIGQLALIPSKIDKSLPLREQALQAFKLRNELKIKARTFMKDRVAEATLPPGSTLKEEVGKSYNDRGNIGDALWHDILIGAQRTNKQVDNTLGLTNSFAPERKKS